VLLSGLALGRIVRQTGLGGAVADAALVPLLARRGGRTAALAAVAVVTPMLVKRLLGDHPLPPGAAPTAYLRRLLLDNDGDPLAADPTPGTIADTVTDSAPTAITAPGAGTSAPEATGSATAREGADPAGAVAEAADPNDPAGGPTSDRAALPGGVADPAAAADGAGAGGVEGGRA
jgi:hypothetical protein